MANSTKAALKAYFETGDFPTQTQFSEMIDNIPEWVEISLTAAQIKTGNTVEIDAIPAPGVGKAIEVISASTKFTTGAIAFTSEKISLFTSGAVLAMGTTSPGILSALVTRFVKLSFTTSNDTQILENTKLVIKADADSGVGDGTAKVYILYRIITI